MYIHTTYLLPTLNLISRKKSCLKVGHTKALIEHYCHFQDYYKCNHKTQGQRPQSSILSYNQCHMVKHANDKQSNEKVLIRECDKLLCPKQLHYLYGCIYTFLYLKKPWYSEPRYSEILDLMNKLQLPFSYFTLYPDSI